MLWLCSNRSAGAVDTAKGFTLLACVGHEWLCSAEGGDGFVGWVFGLLNTVGE